MATKPIFSRNISHIQPQKVRDLKEKISADVKHIPDKPRFLQTTSNSTTLLPNLDEFGPEFKNVFLSTVTDYQMEDGLKETRVIGWCRLIKSFHPLKTPGDGNCLLHSVCQYIWGFTDSTYQLRDLLYVTLVEDTDKKIYNRWRNEQAFLDASIPELQYSSIEWQRDWDVLVRITESLRADQERFPGMPSDSLEDVHVFVLANVLRRPIIILSDPVLRNAFGQSFGPNNFGGIYLPLMWAPKDCCRIPIVLGFYSNHFFPLVNMANQPELSGLSIDVEFAVPIVTNDLAPLRIHYLLPGEERNATVLLQQYLFLTEIEQYDVQKGGISKILAAKLADNYDQTSIMTDYLEDCYNKFINQVSSEIPPTTDNNIDTSLLKEASAPPVSLIITTPPAPSSPTDTGTQHSPPLHKLSTTNIDCSSKGCPHKSGITTHPFCAVCHDKKEILYQMPDSLKDRFLNGSGDQSNREIVSEENLYSIEPLSPSKKNQQLVVGIPSLATKKIETIKENKAPANDNELILEKSYHICIEKDCEEPAIEHLDHMCMRHYYSAANKQMRNITRPVKKESEMSKCRIEGCIAAGYKSTNYLCSKHLSQLPSVTTSTGENTLAQPVVEPEIEYCSTEGCDRISSKNPFRMCDVCFQWVQQGKEPAQEVIKENRKITKSPKKRVKAEYTSSSTPVFTGPQLESLHNTRTRFPEPNMSQVPLGTQIEICVNPICGNQASRSCNGLCYVCFNILCDAAARRAHRDQHAVQASRAMTSGVRRTPCAMENCCRFSQPGLYGYCRPCYDQLVQIRYPSETINNLNVETVTSGVRKSVTPTLKPIKSSECLSEHCKKLGNEALQGLCQDCHKKQLLEFSQIQHENLVRRVEERVDESRLRSQSAADVERNFNRMMTETETASRHATGKCKNLSCHSFGNSKSLGYCNQCYPHFTL
ncbi:uncharacterized protein LOC141915435 isoform X2 [Tubulanus polymorphus]